MSDIDFATLVPKVDTILARGLSHGLGARDGQMCIEAAICAALDLPHGDKPDCVESAVRAFKILLNDARWSSPHARATGLRAIGIAQIGSTGIVSGADFAQRVAELTIRQIIPKLFRAVFPGQHALVLLADRCELEGTAAAATAAAEAATTYVTHAATTALAAAEAADAAAGDDAAAAAAATAAAAAAAGAAAAYAAYAAAAAALVAADAAALAGAADGAAAYAADAAALAGAADEAAAYAANAAAAAASGAAVASAAAADPSVTDATADSYLLLSAAIALEILRALKSPGCAWV